MSKILYIVRHAETDYNKQNLVQGQIDIPLNEVGRQQAEQLGQRLLSEPIDGVFSSDLVRAVATGQPLANAKHLEIHTSELLRERNFGALQGRSWEEIKTTQKEVFNQLYDWEHPDLIVEQAESLNQLAERMLAAVKIILDSEYTNILVVSHGASIRSLLSVIGLEQLSKYCTIGNTDVTIVKHIKEFQFEYVSTTVTKCEYIPDIDELLQLKPVGL